MSPALDSSIAEITDARGVSAPHSAGAFVLFEGERYRLRAPACFTAARLSGHDLGSRGADGRFGIDLPFAVGRYALALVDGDRTVHHAIEVRPAQAKADPATWMALLDDLEAWLPGLVTGAEGAAIGGVGTAGFASPLLVEALLPLLPALEQALTAVLEAPRVRTLDRRVDRPLHQARRADREAHVALGRDPEAVAALRGGPRQGSGRAPTLWVPDTEAALDHAANRHVAWLIHRVLARLGEAARALREAPPTELGDGGRWILGRAAACAAAAERLRRRWRASAFAPLRPEAASEGALLVVQDHPTYARLHRLAWRIIRARFSLTEAPERAATRPSFTLYELWCLLAVQRAVEGAAAAAIGPGWTWRPHGFARLLSLQGNGGGAGWVARRGEDRLMIDFNPTFQSLAAGASPAARHALSKQRRPDLTLRCARGGRAWWAALDAKYRVGQSNVADAMQSAHIYRDALRWPGFGPKARASYLLCPAETADAALWFDADFHAAHRTGALCLRPGQPTPDATRRALAALLEPR